MRAIDHGYSGVPRIRKTFENMRVLAATAGLELTDCLRLVVQTTDMYRYRQVCNEVQVELWGDDPSRYPPRTVVEVDRLNEGDDVS
jgi:enamine deaminase RidA (YjgF/YER057c/UK114 family)